MRSVYERIFGAWMVWSCVLLIANFARMGDAALPSFINDLIVSSGALAVAVILIAADQ